VASATSVSVKRRADPGTNNPGSNFKLSDLAEKAMIKAIRYKDNGANQSKGAGAILEVT